MLSEGGVVLDKVKIAVIDNGVVEKVLRQPLERRNTKLFYMDK